MKKILLTIIVIIYSISIVRAESILEYDLEWDSKQTPSPIANTYEYKDGYLFVDYSEDLECSISLYDKKGNLKKESKIDDLVISKKIDDYIYIATSKIENGHVTFSWSAYNEKLEKINEVNIMNMAIDSNNSNSNNSNIPLGNGELNLISELLSFTLNPTEDGVILEYMKDLNTDEPSVDQQSLYEIRKYKKDLSSYEILSNSLEEEQLYEYFGINKDDDIFLTKEELRRKYNLPEKYNIKNSYTKGDNTAMVIESEGEGFFLLVFNKLNQLYEKELINRSQKKQTVSDVKIVDNHIMIALDNMIDSDHSVTDLYIYNLTTGELEKEINSDKSIFNIVDTKRGFLYHETTCKKTLTINYDNNPFPIFLSTNLANENCSTQRHFYTQYNLVIPKVLAGNGQIIVDENQVFGDIVTLTIKPDEGYTIGKVKVTDANGNNIKLNNYTFTMPSVDVTIEVTFVKAKNPDTKTFYSLLIVGAMIFAFILTLYNRRKIEASR